MNNIDKRYTELQQDILDNGASKGDRTGTGTISVFGRQIRHDMSEGFPLLTTKKMAWKSMVVELLWFLRGETNIRPLVLDGCNIWNGDAYKAYINTQREDVKRLRDSGALVDYREKSIEDFVECIKNGDKFTGESAKEFSEKWGELGPIYGKQWRSWKTFIPYDVTTEGCKIMTKIIDQFSVAIETLKTNPDSRRIMVNSWNVGDLDKMTLPPCHYGYQFWTRELTLDERYDLKQEIPELADLCMPDCYTHEEYTEMGIPTRGVSLMWNQRSVDTFLGLPFNIASYGLLLQIIAQHVNMIPLELIGNLGDTHLYNNHVEQAKEQIPREPFQLPKVNIKPFDKVEHLTFDHFELIDYESHPRIKAPLSN